MQTLWRVGRGQRSFSTASNAKDIFSIAGEALKGRAIYLDAQVS